MPSIIKSNGKVFNFGEDLHMVNGRLFIGSNEVNLNELDCDISEDEKGLHITINLSDNSSIEELNVRSCKSLTINGACRRITTDYSDITINGDALGDLYTTFGDITCRKACADIITRNGYVRVNEE